MSPRLKGALLLLGLAALNGLAHFIPFERASLSNDDISRLLTIQLAPHPKAFLLQEMWRTSDRPLLAGHYLLQLAAGQRPLLAVTLVFLSSTLLAWAVYGIFRWLTGNRSVALACALAYILLPNKVTLYHHLTFTYLNTALVLYAGSFFFFLLFVRRGHRGWLAASVGLYTLGLLSYEAGLFLPAVLLIYVALYARPKALSLLVFLIPLGAYAFWRLDPLGWLPSGIGTPGVKLHRILPNAFYMVPNLYVGRQMVKAIGYGLFRFPTMELPWLGVALAGNAVFFLWLVRWLKHAEFPALPARFLALSGAIFFLFIFPACLDSAVYERHTGLASIGFVPLVLAAARLKPRLTRGLWAGGLALGLIACQGSAWSQVVACRIDRAVAQTITEHQEQVRRCDRVLIDQYSFAQKIPYTWVADPHNHLDTYWGAQAFFMGKHFLHLVHYLVGEEKPIFLVRSPLRREAGLLIFKVYHPDLYRLSDKSVPEEGTFLVDYPLVYAKGFDRGNRGKTP
ncbi:MAG: hypothetical protein HYS41_01660 [Candidatus Omnitrophica bacterium]|nr:hypothetical protein [Candidatus Omnitrophota bacterium]